MPPALALTFLLANGVKSGDIWSQRSDRYILLGTACLLALPVLGAQAAGRRLRRVGVWDKPWQAPLGMFWLLPAIAIPAAIIAAGCLTVMITTSGSTVVPCG